MQRVDINVSHSLEQMISFQRQLARIFEKQGQEPGLVAITKDIATVLETFQAFGFIIDETTEELEPKPEFRPRKEDNAN